MRAFFTYCSLLFITYSFCQNEKCNYITDYYQDVYKAQLSYLQEDYDKAYKILNSIDSDCEFLNQPEIYELIMYAEICAIKGEDKKAYKLLKKALRTGTTFKTIGINENLSQHLDQKYIKKLKRKYKRFRRKFSKNIDSTLRKEIIYMIEFDQKYRNNLDYSKMKIADEKNQTRFKEILNTYGFPNTKLIGSPTKEERTNVIFLLMHFDDVEYFKPLLLEFIRNGECKPSVLGSMVDSYDRRYKKYTYAMYRNLDSTEIKDFKNLDARRISIGLPPLETRKEITKLLLKKYNIDL